MDESQFHQEINHKLDRLANLYKEDQDVDDVVRSKMLSLQNKNSSFLGRTGLLTTKYEAPTTPFESLFTSPNNLSDTTLAHSPPYPSFTLGDPLASKLQAPNYTPPATSYTSPYSFMHHTTNPAMHLSPTYFASSLPNIASYLDNKNATSNLASPATNPTYLTNLTNPHDTYRGLSIEEGPFSSRSDALDQSLALRKPPTNNISLQLSEQISFLLFELKKLKDVNNKLSEQLASCKHELSLTRDKLLTTEAQLHSRSTQDNLSNLVDDVYRSQKVRDMAVVDRLKLAKQERDCALLKASLLQQRILGNQNKDDIVSALMKSQSVDNLKRTTEEFVKMVKEEKGRKREMVEQEMETIIVEKDLVQNQKNEIEKENKALLQRLQEEFKKRKVMQEKQKVTERERDECMDKLRELYDELQKLKVTYNLHGSLTKEKQLHHKYNVLLDGAQDEVEQRQKQVKALTQDREELMGRVRVFQEDNQALKRDTAQLVQQLHDETKEKEQLNRLVEVLRRKLAEG